MSELSANWKMTELALLISLSISVVCYGGLFWHYGNVIMSVASVFLHIAFVMQMLSARAYRKRLWRQVKIQE